MLGALPRVSVSIRRKLALSRDKCAKSPPRRIAVSLAREVREVRDYVTMAALQFYSSARLHLTINLILMGAATMLCQAGWTLPFSNRETAREGDDIILQPLGPGRQRRSSVAVNV
jgi:hypothetical protein